jgi:hypothetical protein
MHWKHQNTLLISWDYPFNPASRCLEPNPIISDFFMEIFLQYLSTHSFNPIFATVSVHTVQLLLYTGGTGTRDVYNF